MHLAVIIPIVEPSACSGPFLDDVLREDVDLFVVDLTGTFAPRGREQVVKAGRALSRVQACNLGLQTAADQTHDARRHVPPRGYAGHVLLAPCAGLSPGFFAGLAEAAQRDEVGLVGPLYDDLSGRTTQLHEYRGPAYAYRPCLHQRAVGNLDESCLFLPRSVLKQVGFLDERFGNYLDAAACDYAIRVKQHGLRVMATSLAYLSVQPGQRRDGAEGRRLLAAKWGGRWESLAEALALGPNENDHQLETGPSALVDVTAITLTTQPQLLPHCCAQFAQQQLPAGLCAEHLIVSPRPRPEAAAVAAAFGARYIEAAPALEAALRLAAGPYSVFWDEAHCYGPHALADLFAAAEGVDIGVVQTRRLTAADARICPESWSGRPAHAPLPMANLCLRTEAARTQGWEDTARGLLALQDRGALVRFVPRVIGSTWAAVHSPPSSSWIAPLGTRDRPRPWEGRPARKPWAYRITAAIPHLNTPESLRLVIALLRLQTERPYLLVIDTGSPPEVQAELEQLRAEDLEIHYIAGHAYTNSSEPVAAAQDLAFALCRTTHLFCTHADVFLRRRDFLAWELSLCTEHSPVVGYEMSPRDNVTAEWRGIPSHTATLFYMPVMHRLGVTWSLQRYYASNGQPPQPTSGWPDTESTMGLCLRQAGIRPLLIGPESNYRRHVDKNLDHVRSYPGSKIYDAAYHQRAQQWMREAMAEARERLAAWQREAERET